MHPFPEQPAARYPALAELTPAHWECGTVRAPDGAAIHFTRTGGAKPALLLLHGVQAAGMMWLRTAQAMQADYDVVMPDLRGHGASARVGDTLSADMMVADVAAVIDALGLGQPAVVGHSMGADIAGRLGAARPLRALALVDPALANVAAMLAFDIDNPPPWATALFATLRSLGDLPHTERLAAARRLLPPGTPEWDPADYVGFVEGLARFDLNLYRHTGAMGYLCEAPDVVARIGCPTLLLTARPMRPGADLGPGLATFTGHLRSCEHVPFPDSGHFIMYDQPERFVETLRAFLRQH